MVMTIHSRLPTPVIPATNQPQWIPAANSTEAPPASTRMVPDIWGCFSIRAATSSRMAP